MTGKRRSINKSFVQTFLEVRYAEAPNFNLMGATPGRAAGGKVISWQANLFIYRVNRVQSANEILNVISEDGGYVIIDSDEWRNIHETIYLNNIKGMSESIIKTSEEPLANSLFQEFNKKCPGNRSLPGRGRNRKA